LLLLRLRHRGERDVCPLLVVATDEELSEVRSVVWAREKL
jgi:hypothetical protein